MSLSRIKELNSLLKWKIWQLNTWSFISLKIKNRIIGPIAGWINNNNDRKRIIKEYLQICNCTKLRNKTWPLRYWIEHIFLKTVNLLKYHTWAIEYYEYKHVHPWNQEINWVKQILLIGLFVYYEQSKPILVLCVKTYHAGFYKLGWKRMDWG